MTPREAYTAGYLAGVYAHAVWRDGKLLVGTPREDFKAYKARVLAGDHEYFERHLSALPPEFAEDGS